MGRQAAGAVSGSRPEAPPPRPRRRRLGAAAIAPLVEAMGPPISAVAWSPQLVAQTLEILAVGLRGHDLFWLKPLHAESLRVGLPISGKPGEVVVGVMGWYPLVPRVVHSTSWRHEHGRVILTYVAVVEPPERLAPDSLVELPVARAELARGDALGPPKAIGIAAVIEHALRHLSWLIGDDAAIAEALSDWTTALGGYQPEPFRALG
jgi:hypothetical protein